MSHLNRDSFRVPDNIHDMDDVRFRIKPHQQILSSCSGALLTSLLMTPLDVVKTRLQSQQKRLVSNKCFVYCNGLMDHLCPCPNGLANGIIKPAQATLHYDGMIDAFYKITRNEGLKSLWSGLGPTLVLAVPATIIYFVCYEQLRIRYKELYFQRFPDAQKPTFFLPLFAGMSARICSVSFVSPLELIRTKMQSQNLNYLELGNALKSLIALRGVGGLWKGLGPTLLRDVPFSGVYWGVYESIKSFYSVTTPEITFTFLSGAVAGSIAAFVTTPFDVVKTHKQIEFGEKVIYTDKPVKLTETKTIDALKKIFRTNGISGIFAGVTPRIIKVAPACAIMITSFEYGKLFFYTRNVTTYENSK